MASTDGDTTDPAATPGRPPHPILTEYYRREEDRRPFVAGLFDASAGQYDRLCRFMSLGSGRWYRRRALECHGLRPGMRLLDVATGTGLVARAAVGVLREANAVVGLDPSAGMLRQARRTVAGPLVQSRVEDLPFRDAGFDFLTIGYALRHAADLDVAFRQCLRVLRPGGRILVLEISRPASPVRRGVIRFYIKTLLPSMMALTTRNRHARMLARYYWDTIAMCVAPEAIVDSLRRSGFSDVRRRVLGEVLSEYTGVRPAAAGQSADPHLGGVDAAKPVTSEHP